MMPALGCHSLWIAVTLAEGRAQHSSHKGKVFGSNRAGSEDSVLKAAGLGVDGHDRLLEVMEGRLRLLEGGQAKAPTGTQTRC
jgi:hypothetical protein